MLLNISDYVVNTDMSFLHKLPYSLDITFSLICVLWSRYVTSRKTIRRYHC